MKEPTGTAGPVRFGAFEADVSSGELRKHGLRIKLPDQSFHILVMLLERPHQVVTREELGKKLWPVETFVDFDHGLNNAMNRLREALGDTADAPHFIETLPRRGYRFIAEVDGTVQTAVAALATAAPTPEPPTVPVERLPTEAAAAPRPRRTGQKLWIGALTLAGIVALLLGANVGGLRDQLRGKSSPPRIQSIAVLPLDNLTGDPAQEYLVDGMTDALITELAQISALKVTSRQSMMQYKGTKKPLPEIANELSVDAVVEGSVTHSGNTIGVNAQLIEAATDRHMWARPYQYELRDIVTLHREVARDIVNEIKVKLTPQEQARLAQAKAVNPGAYQDYLQGRYYWARWNLEGYQKAIEYFQRAIALDPNYAPAYAGLSDAYRMLSFRGPVRPEINMPKAEAAARKAVELDNTLSEAHESLAGIQYRFHWNWVEAESEYKRALQLDPNSALAHHEYGVFLRTAGRYEEAIPQAQRAWELDPLNVHARVGLGIALYIARRYDEAVKSLHETVMMAPDSEGHFILGVAYQHGGNLPAAIAELEKTVKFEDHNPVYAAALGNAEASAGHTVRARELLAELVRRSAKEYVTPYDMAVVEVGLGHTTEAIGWLEKAYQDHSFPLATINSWPWFDPLRSDPRFQDLVRRIGLDPTQPIPR